MSGIVECGHCGMFHAGPCPRIKAIEYYENGNVKRIEYHGAQPMQSAQLKESYPPFASAMMTK